jgi:hypothetical protein
MEKIYMLSTGEYDECKVEGLLIGDANPKEYYQEFCNQYGIKEAYWQDSKGFESWWHSILKAEKILKNENYQGDGIGELFKHWLIKNYRFKNVDYEELEIGKFGEQL